MRNSFLVSLLALVSIALCPRVVTGAPKPQVNVVNMIPASLSGESNQDSEPNLAVNPHDTSQVAGSAFTRGSGICPTDRAPIFISTDEGNTWALNCIVPSDASGMTSDITVRFSGTTDNLYAGILRRPGGLRLNILRTNNFTGASVMTVLVDRNGVDQPYIQATTTNGRDHVYVGDNDFAAPGGRTATVDESLDAAIPAPIFTSIRVESRATSVQDGPPIRPAIHPDGTIYAAFYGWRAFTGSTATTDVVVVRDDNEGAGATPFTDLLDPGDGLVGRRVVQNRSVPWANFSQDSFCQERFVGSNISIAVDPTDSDIVYLAWAERVGDNDYTLRVRRSEDRGATWSANLRTVTDATNPALAVNEQGKVGFLYQQCARSDAKRQRWVTHLELTDDAFTTTQDLILADVPAESPAPQFIPYIGDYVHLMTVGDVFYGIFSANNMPDKSNFPNGVVYQRNADFTSKTLFDNNKRKVRTSIDPYFFRVKPAAKEMVVYKYAAKLICGLQDDPDNMRLAQGFYATAINIHNPQAKEAKFTKTLSLTFPPSQQRPGKVIRISEDKLKEDEALEVDCIDIHQRIFPQGFPEPYIKGFVNITSTDSLDVTAVYTTRGLEQEFCCGKNDRDECCSQDENRDHCSGKTGKKCCHAERCSSCCFKIASSHNSVDVEQIAERVMEKVPPEKTELPDLIPVAPFPPPSPDTLNQLPQNFCFSTVGGPRADAVRIIVRNQGDSDAAKSVTEVVFENNSPIQVDTPLITEGGEDAIVEVMIPDGCFVSESSCSFDITVDATSAVDESNETNNTASGVCPGVVL